MAPIARAVDFLLTERCYASKVMVYADDMVIIASGASLLEQTMNYAVTSNAKPRLWCEFILPVASYECWVLILSRSTSDSCSSCISRAVFSGIRGSKSWRLLAAWSPHQLDVLMMCVHEMVRELGDDLFQEPGFGALGRWL
eukprot:88351-Amphidinium_carterae.1